MLWFKKNGDAEAENKTEQSEHIKEIRSAAESEELEKSTEENKGENGEDTEAENSEKEFWDNLLESSLSDDRMTFDNAMRIPAFSACVDLIANTISMIPFRLYKIEADNIQEVKDDKRTMLLNKDTGDTLDAVQFKRALVRDYFKSGGYAYINRNGLNIESLHYVDNREISFRYSTDPIFKSYDIQVQGASYEPYQFLKLLRSSKNGYESKSIVQENSEILNVAFYSLLFEKNLVKTGGNKKGFVLSKKKLASEAIKKLKSAWKKLYSNSSENVVILNDGLEFKESSNSSVEMQLNENKQTNADEICKIFNMPPAMIKGSAKEEDKVLFIQYCIIPILNVFECALNRDLLLETEKGSYYFAADISELTKGDLKTRYEAYAVACNSGFIQLDEVRFKENLPALGLEYVKLGLQDVLFDTKTKKFFIPNMNMTGGFGETAAKGGESENED